MSSRAVCSLCVAISGSAWAVRTAVSSAKMKFDRLVLDFARCTMSY